MGPRPKSPAPCCKEALRQQNKYGIGQVVFSGKDQIVLVRPYQQVLHMAMLNYAAEIRSADEAAGRLPSIHRTDRKIRLAGQLIENWGEGKFDFSEYVDPYFQKLRELIEAKIEGKEIVTPEAEEEEPEVVNFTDALCKSLGRSTAKPHTASRNARPHSRRSRSRRAS